MEDGALEVVVLEGAADSVDGRFTATRPVALDALPGARLCANDVVKEKWPATMSSAPIEAAARVHASTCRNALKEEIVSRRISAGGNGTGAGTSKQSAVTCQIGQACEAQRLGVSTIDLDRTDAGRDVVLSQLNETLTCSTAPLLDDDRDLHCRDASAGISDPGADDMRAT